jgi:hypothetical protein
MAKKWIRRKLDEQLWKLHFHGHPWPTGEGYQELIEEIVILGGGGMWAGHRRRSRAPWYSRSDDVS